ncbi:cation channel sperm-associated auxiliary subunit gamma-like [Narcine bancroftii]|uniref:cation channel sperm-associated auxiliary subunit gamma-like n=1 Tax=Narcine bancroftii TaxID=1343680 RepID=UPI003830FF70
MFKLFGLLLWPMYLTSCCEWIIHLSKFNNRNEFLESILQQGPAANLDLEFENLTDSNDKLDHYYAFPYFLKIELSCGNQDENGIHARSAHLQGIYPIVKIKFQQPVNSIYNLPELLEVVVTAVPLADDDSKCLEEICRVAWYVPFPYRNGSVVSEVTVTSNKIAFPIVDKNSILLGVDGYLNLRLNLEIGVDQNIRQFDIGHEILEIGNLITIPSFSFPLWYMTDHSPVMILGGIPNRKVVLYSTNEFDTFSILELNIDSCWISSLICPQGFFSATLHDAIATESMLFIRQNQLVYYFKGNFTLLRANDKGSDSWKRVLPNICVEKLIPVFLIQNEEEKLFVIGGGKHKALVFLGTIRDGRVKFKPLLNAEGRTVCSILQSDCRVVWVALDRFRKAALLLVEAILSDYQHASYFLIYYYFEEKKFRIHYKLPLKIPTEKQNVVLLPDVTELSDVPVIPMGITLSHVNSMAYLWGNFLFSSYNLGATWFAVSGVPPHSLIRYFTHSWNGDFIFMTDSEELWYGIDGYTKVTRIRPSRGWITFLAMQKIRGKEYKSKSERTLTVFFDRQMKLKEIVYAAFENGTTKMSKRTIPVDEILSYEELILLPSYSDINNTTDQLTFLDNCPFGIMYIEKVQSDQLFTRVQKYVANPPWIFSSSGLYNDFSLTIYQGLLFGMFNLHSTYYKPYANPIYDPTWRWWKNSRKAQHYYFFLASNKLSMAGLYVETNDYRKMYSVLPSDTFPSIIYLDKGDFYRFVIYLTVNTGKGSEEYEIHQVWMSTHVSSPEYIQANLKRRELLSSGNLVYQVTVEDQMFYQGQSLSGEDLVLVSVSIKIINSDLACFSEFGEEVKKQGIVQLKVYVGCPPGNRFAFDTAYTLNYSVNKNYIYFNCLEPDEIPCFYYEHPFYPFFLIQDMVTGKSDQFLGRYTFKVIGGGPYEKHNIRYFSPQEILLYNSVQHRKSYAAIWVATEPKSGEEYYTSKGFFIFQGDSLGIRWVCQKNSPCSDIPAQGLKGPEYYFVIEVSNRGIDSRTYCDYRLEFIIRLHGLPLNPHRALFFMLITLSILWFVLFFFIFYRCYQHWLKKKIKLLSSIEPVILPPRSELVPNGQPNTSKSSSRTS